MRLGSLWRPSLLAVGIRSFTATAASIRTAPSRPRRWRCIGSSARNCMTLLPACASRAQRDSFSDFAPDLATLVSRTGNRPRAASIGWCAGLDSIAPSTVTVLASSTSACRHTEIRVPRSSRSSLPFPGEIAEHAIDVAHDPIGH